MTKFAPAGPGAAVRRPAFAACSPPTAKRAARTGEAGSRACARRSCSSSASSAAIALLLVHPAIDSGLATFFDRTVVSQIDRTSPFSIWGQVDGIQWLQTVVFAATALLAAALAFVPRRRTLPQVAALSAAVLIALQLSVDHWFYLYIPWFFGAIVIALLCLAPRDAAI